MEFLGTTNDPSEPRFLRWLLALALVCCQCGCRTVAPIHVWNPPEVGTPRGSSVAVATLSIDPSVSAAIETAILEQRPASRADLALVTSRQLLEASPVRLASTAPSMTMISSDLEAIRSAQIAGANLLLFGQVYSSDIDWKDDQNVGNIATANMNRTLFQRLLGRTVKGPNRHIVMSWNVIDVPTGKSLGSQQFKVTSHEVLDRYPDLQSLSAQPTYQLITAAARETWRSVAPAVDKADVRLAVPWFQPGSLRVGLGVRAAKQGQWQMAEHHWSRAASSWLPTPAAHHNLAIAKAAREDFEGAKQQLQHADGPLSIRLPAETLVWLDRHHRLYHQAHQLPEPVHGWSFPDVPEAPSGGNSVQPIYEHQLPWWAGLPGVRYHPID
jgi:hypothetical protein